MTEVLLRKGVNSLLPDNPMAEEALQRFFLGQVVKIKLPKGQQRSIQQLRLYWGLVKIVLNNQEHYKTARQVDHVIKIGVGHCDTVQSRLLGETRIPRSISFSKMTQDEANAFMDRVLDFICQDMLPGLRKPDLEREVHEIIAQASQPR